MAWEAIHGIPSTALWGAVFGISLAALIAFAILIFSNKIGKYLSRRLLKKMNKQSNQGVKS